MRNASAPSHIETSTCRPRPVRCARRAAPTGCPTAPHSAPPARSASCTGITGGGRSVGPDRPSTPAMRDVVDVVAGACRAAARPARSPRSSTGRAAGWPRAAPPSPRPAGPSRPDGSSRRSRRSFGASLSSAARPSGCLRSRHSERLSRLMALKRPERPFFCGGNIADSHRRGGPPACRRRPPGRRGSSVQKGPGRRRERSRTRTP